MTAPRIRLFTSEEALEAMTYLETAQENISAERAHIGADMSRLSVTLSHLSGMRTGYLEAAARITDADIAQESAEMTRLLILQQAGAAILAQANQTPQLVLRLLG